MNGLFILRLFIIIGSIFPLWPESSGLLDERIRMKVENLTEQPLLEGELTIYAVPAVQDVYLKHDFAPFWTDRRRVNELVRLIEHSDEEGFVPNDYHLLAIQSLRYKRNIEDRANLDILLTDAFLLYSTHLLSGKTLQKPADPAWRVDRSENNPAHYLFELSDKSLSSVYDELAPKTSLYEGLKVQLKQYREIAKQGGWDSIAAGELLKPGMTDPRMTAIRSRLIVTGDLAGPEPENPEFYDENLMEAVIHYQERQGLEALGNIGPQTIAMLNVPVEDRIKQIEVNLERIRWLPRNFPSYFLLVNIADFTLTVHDSLRVQSSHKVIVGRSYRQTPMFHSTLRYMVLNPTWTIPPNILKYDVIPDVRKDSTYLEERGIRVYNRDGEALSPKKIDWQSSEVMRYTFRQDPGPKNALGVVKFMLPNQFNVYLHDTPSKNLFQRIERTYSSGCIRVERPLELAVYLLKADPGWDLTKIRKVIASGKTVTVFITRQPEVYLLYLTAWADEDGQLQFRNDIYNRDEPIYIELLAAPSYVYN